MDAPTVVEGSNETTTVSKLGKVKPVVVHENNDHGMKRTDKRIGIQQHPWCPRRGKKGRMV